MVPESMPGIAPEVIASTEVPKKIYLLHVMWRAMRQCGHHVELFGAQEVKLAIAGLRAHRVQQTAVSNKADQGRMFGYTGLWVWAIPPWDGWQGTTRDNGSSQAGLLQLGVDCGSQQQPEKTDKKIVVR
jgi:hypothetical protein